MSNKRYISMQEVQVAIEELLARVGSHNKLPTSPNIYGIPRGGAPVALAIAYALGGSLVDDPSKADLIVDDIYDSGATLRRYEKYAIPSRVLFDKRDSRWKDQWLILPWEAIEGVDESATDNIIRLLQFIGENPEREGLKETPQRVLQYYQAITSGYSHKPESVLKSFEDGAEGVDEMVLVGSINFHSMCEHHLAPFFGVAHIAYIPNGKILGLSKFARLLEIYARRLQVQERLTNQIADDLVKYLVPKGVGIVIRARHLCMESRGVQKVGAVTYTSALRGAMKEKPAARAEFMQFVAMADAKAII